MAYNRDRAPKEDNGPEMIEKVVYLNRVSKTVKGGRVMKFSALVVVGDGKGTVGYGLGRRLKFPKQSSRALLTRRRTWSRSRSKAPRSRTISSASSVLAASC